MSEQHRQEVFAAALKLADSLDQITDATEKAQVKAAIDAMRLELMVAALADLDAAAAAVGRAADAMSGVIDIVSLRASDQIAHAARTSLASLETLRDPTG